MITNIRCICTEYRLSGSEWVETDKCVSIIDSQPIENMVESKDYFLGKMRIDLKHSRRLGNIVYFISSQCEDAPIRRTYNFDYSEAKYYETERGISFLS